MSELVTITVDGREVQVPAGQLLIKALQDSGTYVPHFCWHERLKPAGMCRACLVEVDGPRGMALMTACTMPVADGMTVATQSETAVAAQEGVLEFLLINHPLDCPVCDKGGECPLQDQTVAFGPGESRFVEDKRHYAKPIPISDLVLLDRERCILCARCTRFADEIAGDPLITFTQRGGSTQVLNYVEDPFVSYFSGNTVQICPVGALTSSSYRFKARPWDLATTDSSCTTCSVGCRAALQSSSDELIRMIGVDSEPVNHGWLCDRGRYGFGFIHSVERRTEPVVRHSSADGAQFETVSWPDALDEVGDRLGAIATEHGGQAIGIIGGSNGTNEDAYVWSKLARTVLGTNNVDAQLDDGLPAEVIQGLPRAEISDLESSSAIVLLGPDLKEELPVLYLRVRRAALEKGVPLIEVAPYPTGLTPYASVRVGAVPGHTGEVVERIVKAAKSGPSAPGSHLTAEEQRAAELLSTDGKVTVILGRPSLAEGSGIIVRAAAALATIPQAKFLSALRRSNVHGALEMGLAPTMLPGRVSLDAGRDYFSAAWATDGTPAKIPATPGMSTGDMLRAAVDGRIKALVLVGSDPIGDFPDRELAERALDRVAFLVSIDGFDTASTSKADVVLPPMMQGETDGTFTNLEGRILPLTAKVTAAGTSMEDWRIAAEIAWRLGADFGFLTTAEVQDEIAAVAPAMAGIDSAAIAASGLGLLPAAFDDVVEAAVAASVAGDDTVAGDAAVADAATSEDAQQSDSEEVSTEAGPSAPPLYVWDGTTDVSTEVPAPDAYGLRLIVGRKLYTSSVRTIESPTIAALAAEPVLLVNPADRDKLGFKEGESVRVHTVTGTANVGLRMRSDESMPRGLALVWHDPESGAATLLLDAGKPAQDIRIDRVEATS